ncbi:12371_t:CDS:2, partial [Gigaspora rosea]
MKIGGCSAVFLSLLALVLVLLSFVGINPEVPKQAPYRFTGYLSWLPKQEDDNDVASSPTIDFNRVLAIYIVTTLLAGAVLFFVGAGKIWVAVGVFHNASEFIILIMLGSGGKIKSSTFWPILGFYIFIISITCILFKFPYDALWFKGQGLCFDWALIIEFTRIYLTTLHELKHGGANHDDLDELIENEDDSSHHKSIIHHPHQLLLLIFDFHVSSIYPKKRIYLPETPSWKVAAISIFSIALSLLTIRL